MKKIASLLSLLALVVGVSVLSFSCTSPVGPGTGDDATDGEIQLSTFTGTNIEAYFKASGDFASVRYENKGKFVYKLGDSPEVLVAASGGTEYSGDFSIKGQKVLSFAYWDSDDDKATWSSAKKGYLDIAGGDVTVVIGGFLYAYENKQLEIDGTAITVTITTSGSYTTKFILNTAAESTSTTTPALTTGMNTLVVGIYKGTVKVGEKTYLIRVNAPTVNAPILVNDDGTPIDFTKTYDTQLYVKFANVTAGSTVRYSTKTTGGSWVEGTANPGSFWISSSMDVKVRADLNGTYSREVIYSLNTQKSAMPTFKLNSNSVSGTITANNGDKLEIIGTGTIRYTLTSQGNTMNPDTNSTQYSGIITVTSSCVIRVASWESGKAMSDVNTLTITVSGGTVTPPPVTPPASSFSFGVSFTPSGTRPTYIFKLYNMSNTSTSQAIVDGTSVTTVNLAPGWYAAGAGSSTVGWLAGGAFTMTIGTLTSPAVSSFMVDVNGNKQWFYTVKNDGTMVQGLVSLN